MKNSESDSALGTMPLIRSSSVLPRNSCRPGTTDKATLARLAVMERCEPVLLHVAGAAARVAPDLEPWAFLRVHLPTRHRVRTEALPHWSRFVLQTGYTPAGRGQHIEWLTRDE
jgi:hypothetical protein